MKPTHIEHIGIAVASLDEAIPYYEKVLGQLIYLQEFDVKVVSVPETMWCEIDDADDLARAKKQFEIN